MDNVRPSLVSLVWLVYRDTGRALWALRYLAVTACLISIAHSLLRLILTSPSITFTISGESRAWIALVFVAGWIFLLVPFLIAIHRFILLDEATPHYAIQTGPRALRFFGSWIILSIVAGLPALLAFSAFAASRVAEGWLLWGLAAPLFLLSAAFCLRMTLLLPAIAVDAPGASWVNAYQDTRGHSLGILLIYGASVVPFALFGVLLMAAAWLVTIFALTLIATFGGSFEVARLFATFLWLLALNITYVGSTALMLVIASRLYQLLGDRVKSWPNPKTA
jgi:hypothetical protein